jgi:hypothetical protein
MTHGVPRYDCVFTHEGREVFHTPFNFYGREWDEFRKPAETKEWARPWDEKRHGPRDHEDYDAWQLRLFGKPRSKMDREERTAEDNFMQHWRDPKMQEHKFIVIERTIVIPNP